MKKTKQPYHHWRSGELAHLRQHSGQSLDALAQFFNVSQRSIRQVCNRNKISIVRQRTHKRWMMREVSFMENNPQLSIVDLALHLNRTSNSIVYYKMHLRKRVAA
jgi:hypothetical protein